MPHKELTEKEYWDGRWDRVKLPIEIEEKSAKYSTKKIIELIGQHLPAINGLKILEIGGAPGRWLAYFKKNFHYDIHAIDYSETGCQKIRDNFELLRLDVSVHMCNLLTDDISALPRFDVVYSLGFVEHFSNLDEIIEKHLDLLKEEGILIVGVPNFSGIAKQVLQKTSPGMLKTHNLEAMDLRTWEAFEKTYPLEPLFKGYLGGFDLHHCRRCDLRTPFNRLIRFFFKVLTRMTDRMHFLRRYNSRLWSPYMLVIYKKEKQPALESRLPLSP